jgi:hypothetical protein
MPDLLNLFVEGKVIFYVIMVNRSMTLLDQLDINFSSRS